jgi:hypothetical protein
LSGTENGGQLYWRGLLNYLRNGTSRSTDIAVQKFIQVMNTCVVKVPVLLKSTYKDVLSNKTLFGPIMNLGDSLDTEFASQIVGRIALLASKVLEHDSALVTRVQEIGLLRSPIRQFHELNWLLRVQERFKYPCSSPTDSFMMFNETDLVQLINGAIKKKGKKEDAEHTEEKKRKSNGDGKIVLKFRKCKDGNQIVVPSHYHESVSLTQEFASRVQRNEKSIFHHPKQKDKPWQIYLDLKK